MNSETLLIKSLNKEKKIKQKAQTEKISKNFSWVLFFAGEEYNQELAQQKIPEKNIIDFAKFGSEKGDQELEQSLLPVFDHQQNTELFSDKIDLSNYILIATSATPDISQLSPPLVSRLECINHGKNDPRPYFKEVRPELIALAEKHLQECEKAKSFLAAIDAKKHNSLIYDNEKSLKEKGYNENLTIEQIKNLKEEKRVGVVKELGIIDNKENNLKNHEIERGRCSDTLSFLTPSITSVTHQNFPNLLTKDQSNFFHTFQNEIVGGESGTLSLYLALLSAYHQKPISQNVAATGFLNIGNYEQLNHCPWCFREEIAKNPNKNLTQHKISPVGGLEYKVPAAVEAGVKKLILSVEQKENYEKNVPQEIRKKLTVYYVKDVEELEKLFWEGEFS
ncbi:29283_t:CDS:2 [Gigaspora margarita]|uniref:29283_t:CDS:1 n=1 Tax=Gigaspora margarita TaxID=4874 RepID=A0ABM8W131_GIGMA|nr:29283_t:CDS:2 [Gigaspora margarita]